MTRRLRPLLPLCFALALVVACDDDEIAPATLTPRPSTTTTRTNTPPPGTATLTVTATGEPGTTTPTPTPGEGAVPDRDLVELARRLGHVTGPIPDRLEAPASYVIGEPQRFFVLDVGGPKIIELTATLRFASEHAYFYFQDDITVSDDDLQTAGDRVDNQIWPLITSEFGADPGPGYDGDARIAILHANVPGVGGYFTDQDLFPPIISPFSNQREMIVLNSSGLDVTSDDYLGLVTHELQHLVHHFADSSEDSWINEGLSEVANFRASGSASFIPVYLQNPDLQLNDWGQIGGSAAHYGQANLFLHYLLQRTGGLQNAHLLAAQPGDGFDGLRDYLAASGVGLTIEQIFRDWVVANYIDEGEGPYGYSNLDSTASATERFGEGARTTADVAQFGADYLQFTGDADRLTVRFEGDATVPVLPVEPPGSDGLWWGNRGDSIDTRLTREFDLTAVAGATLTYQTWFDIENGWDFAYVEASRDNGATWDILSSPSATTANPLKIAYGPAYTGRSGNADAATWIDESVDLTPYTGDKVLVRFEYVTDEALNQAGWALANIAIPEIGFIDSGSDGWQSEGFPLVIAPLRQKFAVQLIIRTGDGTRVEQMALDATNAGEFVIDGVGGPVDDVTVAVSGVTEGTTERASYSVEFVTG